MCNDKGLTVCSSVCVSEVMVVVILLFYGFLEPLLWLLSSEFFYVLRKQNKTKKPCFQMTISRLIFHCNQIN